MPRAKRDPTNRDRQARYHLRMRAAGYVRLSTWIHQNDLARVSRYLERLRREHEG